MEGATHFAQVLLGKNDSVTSIRIIRHISNIKNDLLFTDMVDSIETVAIWYIKQTTVPLNIRMMNRKESPIQLTNEQWNYWATKGPGSLIK